MPAKNCNEQGVPLQTHHEIISADSSITVIIKQMKQSTHLQATSARILLILRWNQHNAGDHMYG